MESFFKDLITIVAIIITFVKCRQIKDKTKRIIVFMAILLAISTFHNRSIYWFLYWDGPYHGQVVDADTGEPIEGAAVAATWSLEQFIFYLSSTGPGDFAGAKATVTDADGKFILPPTFAFSFWPFSEISRGRFWVFNPGYDSHPPSKQRAWTTVEKEKYGMSNREYRDNFLVKCKMWRKCLIRLNKAMTIRERREAFAEVDIVISNGASYKNMKGLKAMVEIVKNEDETLKALIRKKRRESKAISNHN